jgi:hypothetical protein
VSSRLLDQTRSLLDMAAGLYSGTPLAARIDEQRDRLDEPLRVAIAGKVKAGKSTLLNALVGEELAPTDEGECTKIVTWYRDGITYRVNLYPHEGPPQQVPFARDAGALDIDLGSYTADQIERLDVEWPSSALKQITLIDTPGIGSLSEDVSQRTTVFLTPGDEQVTPADAVLYLMRHLHTTDLGFLEAFHDDEFAQATPVNAIGILSRADEVAVGRLDAMQSASKIAARYRSDPKVRQLVQTVVPVAGLLAQTGVTLREAEYRALAQFAGAPTQATEALFLSADRFIRVELPISLTSLERQALLERFGLFGIKLATKLIREGAARSANELANELVRRSGLIELREVLLSQFAGRRDVLKARTGLLSVLAAIHEMPTKGSDKLASEAERLQAGAHEFAELRLLNALRAGSITTDPDLLVEMERLLGTTSSAAAVRLGLAANADVGDIRRSAAEALHRWRAVSENPMTDQTLIDASRVLERTCEGILADY